MPLPDRAKTLVVGAGPTGLAAALFLAEKGVRARVIDKAEAPSATSRAQVVNPRSLELLQSTGVTEAILAESRPARGVSFYEDWRPLCQLDLSHLPSAYPMSVLAQARTEALLTQALRQRGVEVERGVALQSVMPEGDRVGAVLTHADGSDETLSTPLLLAADGAHSQVRQRLGVPFNGHAFAESWPLYDLQLDDLLPIDRAHVCFLRGGLIFMLCLRPGVWRVFGDVENLLDFLPKGAKPGEIEWQSSFHIADHVASDAVVGRIALAGDAAHIHSPVGARGMNLGIEDAYVYAACANDALQGRPERLSDYARLRHPVHKHVVHSMDRLTTLARGRPDWVGLLRHRLMPALIRFGPTARAMRNLVTGLDHAVRTA